MHPVLVTVPGGLLLALCACALAYGPLSLAYIRLRGRAIDAESLAFAAWSAFFALCLFALGSADVPTRGLFRALSSAHGWSAPWRPLVIYSYGTLLAAGILSGVLLSARYAATIGFTGARYYTWCAVASVSALLGARGLYIIVRFSEYVTAQGAIDWAKLIIPGANGFVVYGGFIAGVLGTIVYARVTRVSVWQITDLGTLSVPLGLALGRTGCYLAGCDFGRPIEGNVPAFFQPIASFPRWPSALGSPAWWQHTHSGFASTLERCRAVGGSFADGLCTLSSRSHASVAVHPTQLYELTLALALLAVQVRLYPRRRFDGQVSLTFMILYGLGRSALELVRDDIERGRTAGLTTSQWIGLSTAAFGLAAYAWRSKHAGPRRATIAG